MSQKAERERENCTSEHVFVTHSGNSKLRMAEVKEGLGTQSDEIDC